MTLRTACGRIAVCVLVLCVGCATASPARDSLLSRLSSPAERSAEPGPTSPAPDRVPNESGSRKDDRTGTANRATRPFDAATMMLIETELRDCTPDEREQWMGYLQTVDRAVIPHVLQARRMQASGMSGAPGGDPSPRLPAASDGGMLASALPDGHSPIARSGSAPRLELSGADGGFATGAPQAGAAPLSAPEPHETAALAGGISPFGRQREVTPAVQTGYEAFLPGNGSIAAQGVSSAPFSVVPVVLPAISPNQPSAVPDGPGEMGPGHLEYPAADHTATAGPPTDASLSSSTLQGAYWQETLQRLTALVEAEVAVARPGLSEPERVEYVKRHVWLRMLYLMAEQPQRAQQAIPGLDPAEQEFWTALFWAVSNYFDAQTAPESSQRAAMTLQQLDYAHGRLQRIAALELRNVSFCYKINSFGNFESWQRDEFRPGQTVLLYAEVRNFESRPTAQGTFTTSLKSFIEIRRGRFDGEVVEQNVLPTTQDLCRSVRHDYFHSYTIDLPQQLSPGPYTLVLTVEDEFSGKRATQAIGFLIR